MRALDHGTSGTSALLPLALCALLLEFVVPSGAQAGHLDRYALRAPRIDMLVHAGELHAVDGTRVRTLRLGRREQVLWVGVANRLAVAVTDDRVIAITTQWKEWQIREFGVHESLPSDVLAGDDFVLVVTDDRVLSVSDRGGSFVETQLGAYERVGDVLIAERVGLVLTDRRVIGFSGRLASLVEERVGIHEDFDRVHAAFDFATVATSKRLLVFDAPTGNWQSNQLALR